MTLSVLYIAGLSGVWCMVIGEFSLRQWAVGLFIGSIFVLGMGWGRQYKVSLTQLPRRAVLLLWLFGALLPYHLIKSNLRMAGHLLHRHPSVNPGIVRVRSKGLTLSGLGLEEQMISMAPGQFVVDYSADEEVVYVHLIDVTDFEEKGESSVIWMHDVLKRIMS